MSRQSGPPQQSELLEALEADSGYPLEVRVWEIFRDAGLYPNFGKRARVSEDPSVTKEIDLVAQRASVDHNSRARGETWFYVQCKKLREGGIVGFSYPPSVSMGLMQRRFARTHLSGRPDGTIPSEHWIRNRDVVVGDAGLGAAFDALNEAPFCIQWCVAYRDGQGRVQLGQEHRVWEAIADTVRACCWAEREVRLAYEQDDGLTPALFLHLPILVIDAPLWTYDVAQKVLTPTESLAVVVSVDTSFAGVHSSVVDIVTATGLPTYVGKQKRAMELFGERIASHATELVAAIREQREALK
jgi:hypothetical protein